MSRLPGQLPAADALLAEARGLSSDFDRLSQAVSGKVGLSSSDLLAIDLISRGERVTAGQLARELNLTTGAITGLVDRLEKAGFARRAFDPTDRRRVLIVATQKEQRVRALYRPLDASLRRTLATYSDAELTMLNDFIRRLRLVVSGAVDGLQDANGRPNRPVGKGRRSPRANERTRLAALPRSRH